jgi:hypothetical protein
VRGALTGGDSEVPASGSVTTVSCSEVIISLASAMIAVRAFRERDYYFSFDPAMVEP